MTVFARINKESDQAVLDNPAEPQKAANPVPEAHPPARGPAGLSVMSAALTVIGQLQSAGAIQIDGRVEGDIRGHMVKIGNDAVIKGMVYGEGVELAGTIDGKIEAKTVVLTRTARMSGDIIHQTLRIEQGAQFEGTSRPHRGKAAFGSL